MMLFHRLIVFMVIAEQTALALIYVTGLNFWPTAGYHIALVSILAFIISKLLPGDADQVHEPFRELLLFALIIGTFVYGAWIWNHQNFRSDNIITNGLILMFIASVFFTAYTADLFVKKK